MSVIYSSCPIVRREIIDLMRWIDKDGLGNLDSFRFQYEILWLREGRVKILYLHGGKVLKDEARFADFFGLLSCLGEATDFAAREAAIYGVDASSSLEILVRATVDEVPVLEDKSPEARMWGPRTGKTRRYMSPPLDWLLFDEEKEARWLSAATLEERLDIVFQRLERRKVLTSDVWSSRRTEDENAAALADFTKSAKPD